MLGCQLRYESGAKSETFFVYQTKEREKTEMKCLRFNSDVKVGIGKWAIDICRNIWVFLFLMKLQPAVRTSETYSRSMIEDTEKKSLLGMKLKLVFIFGGKKKWWTFYEWQKAGDGDPLCTVYVWSWAFLLVKKCLYTVLVPFVPGCCNFL